MSELNPYEQLGVTRGASFEEIQEAKNRLSQQYQEDSRLLQNVEAAYDAIIMDRLKMRQEGKIKVPERIRFPERKPEAPPSLKNPINVEKSPTWLQNLLDTPSKEDILWSGITFLVLGGLTIFSASADQSLLSLLTALGFGASIYLLNRKENRLGRAVIITFVALLVGVGLGTFLAGISGITLTSINVSPDQFTVLVTFFLFWMVSSFLR